MTSYRDGDGFSDLSGSTDGLNLGQLDGAPILGPFPRFMCQWGLGQVLRLSIAVARGGITPGNAQVVHFQIPKVAQSLTYDFFLTSTSQILLNLSIIGSMCEIALLSGIR